MRIINQDKCLLANSRHNYQTVNIMTFGKKRACAMGKNFTPLIFVKSLQIWSLKFFWFLCAKIGAISDALVKLQFVPVKKLTTKIVLFKE